MPSAIGTYATLVGVKARAGITNTADDTLLSALCGQTNQLIESVTGKVIAPMAAATYTFDGTGTQVLRVPMGVRSVSLLEIAPYTGAAYETVPAADYFLRPLPQDRNGPGWPATQIVLSDWPTGTYRIFPKGQSNVRATITPGWDAIPDDLVALAEIVTVRAWQARLAGESEIIGTAESGGPIIGASLRPAEIALLRFYARELPGY